MKFFLLTVLLYLLPIWSSAQILFAAAEVRDNDLFKYRNVSLIRRAMLKTNGKDWFMKNLIYSDPKLMPFYLNFIAGGYCTAGEVYRNQNGTRNEFFDGLLKAIVCLSENNDTLYYFITVDEINFKTPIKGELHLSETKNKYPAHDSENIKHRYDFDKFYGSDGITRTRQNVDYMSIMFDENFSPRICLNTTEKELPIKLYPECIDDLIEKYTYYYTDDHTHTPPYNLVTNAEEAEFLFNAILAFDNFIISLNPKERVKMKMLPWIYIAGIEHEPLMNLNSIPDF